MKPKTLGIIIPYAEFAPWLHQHGPNLVLFVRELFANRIGAFFGMDVVVTALVLLIFTRIENNRLPIRNRWLVLLAVLTVGVSLGLPLFLYLREIALERRPAEATA